MELILIDDVISLGKRGDVVNVAAGYGRNYLVPKGLAVPATAANLKMIEQQRLAMAKKEAKLQEEAEVLAGELNQLHLVLSRKAGDTGVLFGSVTAKDLAELMEANGVHIDRRKIALDHPVKSLGNLTVSIHPHSNVKADVLLSVIPEEDEAVSRMLRRGAESDKIFDSTAATIKAIQAAQEAEQEQAEEAADSEESPAE